MSKEQTDKLETGSTAFDSLLQGGLMRGSVTDVYGAAATGKTQFAFQNALFASIKNSSPNKEAAVVFVDCAGSFRPERIAEMAEIRGFHSLELLDRIFAINVRSVSAQKEVSERILASSKFERCKLLIVDDVTTNFVAEFPSEKKGGRISEDVYIRRHYELATYARKLAFIAYTRNMAVLLTNSIRARISNKADLKKSEERETTGDIMSQYGLFRLYFTKYEDRREAEIVEPWVMMEKISFQIETRGIVP